MKTPPPGCSGFGVEFMWGAYAQRISFDDIYVSLKLALLLIIRIK